MKTIDARGIDCPKPVILTKNELDKMDEGQTLTIADNDVCVQNLKRFAEGQGYGFEVKDRDDGNYDVVITKTGDEVVEDTGKGKLTIGFGSDKMGTGDEELGHILIKSLMYTISETDPLPDKIVFFNTGVNLTTEGSEVLDDLKKLEEKGVTISSCGTCLDYYDLREKLKIGDISNMYDIYESLEDADRNIILS